MHDILEEIKTSPGVLGACIFTASKGILASNLPPLFKNRTQERIGHTLNRIFKLNETIQLDINGLEVQYDEALIIIKRLCNTSSLVIICEPDANIHLINMAASVLLEDLQELITDCEKVPLHSEAREETPQDVVNGELAAELSQMKRALAMHIGPVAGKILEKHLATWLQQGAPGKERLADLARLLAREIDDETKRQVFFETLQEVV